MSGTPIKDMMGMTFGRLVVIGRGEGARKGVAYWLCRCECGAEKSVAGHNLRNGAVQSCGCLRVERSTAYWTKPVLGKRFGRLVVVERIGSKRKLALWRCRCDCGGEAEVTGSALARGRVVSCGCARRDHPGLMAEAERKASIIRSSRRRARAKGAGGSFTEADVAARLRQQGGRCAWCRTKISGDLIRRDHRIPLHRGGSNDAKNIDVLCDPCNARKGHRAPEDWARTMGFLI